MSNVHAEFTDTKYKVEFIDTRVYTCYVVEHIDMSIYTCPANRYYLLTYTYLHIMLFTILSMLFTPLAFLTLNM